MGRRPQIGVTIAEIAKTCKVSPATVSRVLYNRPCVADELRRKIRREIVRSGYVFQRTSRSGKVLLLSPAGRTMIHGEYYYELFNALQVAFRQIGYEAVAGRSAALPLIGNIGFDAVISCTGDKEVFRYWSLHLIAPLIYVNWEVPSPSSNCFSVCADHKQALRDAVNLLHGKGHRRIGLLVVGFETPDNQRIWAEREGFFSEMKRLGLAAEAQIEYTSDQEPHQALTNLLRRNISALICPSITDGGKVVRILHDLRWEIPRSLSVIVGDSAFYDQVNTIPLTALRMPYQKMAESCCAIVQGRPAPVTLPYEIIQRESILEHQP